MKILLIEDDIQLSITIQKFLQIHQHEVILSFDGEEALNRIDYQQFDLYIIDINIPYINGLELVSYIRSKDLLTPIVIITASLEVNNFIEAFDNGANEYIKKPFHLKELEVRLNKLFQGSSRIIKLNDVMAYDFSWGELLINGKPKKLRKKVSRLLEILLKNINHVVDTDVIIDYVWENEFRRSYPLRQLVAELRKELISEKNHIVSVSGIGYKFES